MSAARASLSVSVRRLSIAASIVGCVAGAATMHGQKKGFACDKDNGGLTLPAGFCAGVIADNLGTARNLVVAPNGDIFVSVRSGPSVQGQPPQPGFILGLRDTNGDGKIDVQEKFGTQGATGIRLRNGYLYYATPTSIERFKLTPGELKPSGPAEVIVGDFPSGATSAGIGTRTSRSTTRATSTSTSACRRTRARSRIARRVRRAWIPVRSSKSTAASGSSAPTRRTEILEGEPLCHRHAAAGRARLARRQSLRRDEQPRFARHAVSRALHGRRQREPAARAAAAGQAGLGLRLAVLLLRRAANKMILAPEYGGDGKDGGTLRAVRGAGGELPRRTTRRSICCSIQAACFRRTIAAACS